MRDKGQKEINENTYYVSQMDAVEALKTQIYLGKLLAPAIVSGAVGNDLEQGLVSLFEKMDNQRFVDFFVNMCEQATVKKAGEKTANRISFNSHFDGASELKHAQELFIFVLNVNFKDFMNDVLKFTASMKQGMSEASIKKVQT